MARIRTNNVFGDAAVLTDTDTTLSSPGLADLPAISSPDIAVIVLDPDRTGGAPEIVHVTAHTASATTATIVRGQEGTTAREHAADTPWIHTTTAKDLNDGNVLGGDASNNAQSVAAHPTATTTGTAEHVAIGNNAAAEGAAFSGQERGSVAIGNRAKGQNVRTVAVGGNAVASGPSAVAVGADAVASSASAIAFGWKAAASGGTGAIAIGESAVAGGATNFPSMAIGKSASTGTNTKSTAVGHSSVSGFESIAAGYSASANGQGRVAVGFNAVAGHDDSVALGRNVSTSTTFQVMIGPRDLEITGTTKGIVLVDRTLGTRHRVYLDNGSLNIEAA